MPGKQWAATRSPLRLHHGAAAAITGQWHVPTLWKAAWAAADETFALYLKAPVMNREGLRVTARMGDRFALIESWVKPRLLAAMPAGIKKQLTARGVQGLNDEAGDIL